MCLPRLTVTLFCSYDYLEYCICTAREIFGFGAIYNRVTAKRRSMGHKKVYMVCNDVIRKILEN